jgi:hypothetical protein
MIQTNQLVVCSICRILDYDCTPKLCSYCPLCDAWICAADNNRWDRRLRAAIKRKLEPGYKGLQNYEEVVVQNKGELQ